jgi:hypothetical protein
MSIPGAARRRHFFGKGTSMSTATRRRFLRQAGAGSAFVLGGLALAAAAPQDTGGQKKADGKGGQRPARPRLDADLVRDFVAAAHRDLDRVRQMLEGQRGLINATWDWGGGDFETALGGAAHMGRRDIATFLLERGARLDLFAAAMLGHVEVVRAAVTAYPDVVNVPGPHGITLLAHARAGRRDAEAVVRYLEALPRR